MDRAEFIAAGAWLHDVYKTELLRPDGLWIDGHPDWEGIGAWLFDVYLTSRETGLTPDAARGVILQKIRQSDEWRAKHPVAPVPLPPGGRAFPPEAGPLTIDRIWFLNQGRVWAHRGASFFTLPARARAGQNITPQILWMQRHGVNVARFFVNWTQPDGGGGVHAGDRAFDDPVYPVFLRLLARRLRDEGLRAQFNVVTENGMSLEYWRRALQECYDVAAGTDNITIEPHNEPWVRDTRPQDVLAGIARHGVLTSLGIRATPGPSDGFLPMAREDYADFGTHRSERDPKYLPKSGKDLEDLRGTTKIPWIDDEPVGLMDVPNRGGRSNDRDAVLSHFAVSMLFGGVTIHTQAGIDGLTPEQTNEPITEAICDGITALWQFFPPEVQTGEYINTGRDGGTGIVYAPNDSLVNRAYGSRVGDTLYVVVPVPRPNWTPVLQPGWRLAEKGPIPGVLKLERE